MRVCRGAKGPAQPDSAKDGRTLWSQERALRLETEIGYEQLVLPLAVEAGFYRVEAALTVEGSLPGGTARVFGAMMPVC